VLLWTIVELDQMMIAAQSEEVKVASKPEADLRLFMFGLVALIAITALIVFNLQRDFIYDDTYIGLRYAKNLADGKGLAFSGNEHVEGFSNLLWVVILAGLRRLTGGDLVSISKWTGFTFSLLTLWLSGLVLNRIRPVTAFSQIGLLAVSVPLILTVPSYFLWTISGLENALYAFLLLVFVYFLFKDRVRSAGFALLAAALTRPEAPVFAVAALFCFTDGNPFKIIARRPDSVIGVIDRGLFRKILPFYVIVGSGLLLITLFRLIYFHDVIPNTVYVKAAGDFMPSLRAGFTYLTSFYQANTWFCIAFLCAIPSFVIRSKARESSTILAILILQAIVTLRSGGDWMAHHRFIASFVPLLALAVWAALFDLASVLKGRLAPVALATASALLFITSWEARATYITPPPYAEALNRSAVSAGKWLKATSPPGRLVAVGDAGAIPYFSDLRILDLHGLMDKHIGMGNRNFSTNPHTYVDVDYVFAHDPDWIVVIATNNYDKTLKSRPEYGLYAQLMADSRFSKDFVFVKQFDFNASYHYHIYVSQRKLPSIVMALDLGQTNSR